MMTPSYRQPPGPPETNLDRRSLSVVIEGRTYPLTKISDRGFSVAGMSSDAMLGESYQALFILCDHPEECSLDCKGKLIHDNRKCLRFHAELMAVASSDEGVMGFGFTDLTPAQRNLVQTIIDCVHTQDL